MRNQTAQLGTQPGISISKAPGFKTVQGSSLTTAVSHLVLPTQETSSTQQVEAHPKWEPVPQAERAETANTAEQRLVAPEAASPQVLPHHATSPAPRLSSFSFPNNTAR